MKVKTSELAGPALEWAVARCKGIEWELGDLDAREYGPGFKPSTTWADGGPIIEREGIEVKKGNPLYFPKGNEDGDFYEPLWLAGKQHGQTPLIAAMRYYVASKLGDEIEIPEELQ